MGDPVIVAPPEWPRWPDRTIFDDVAAWCYDNVQQPDGPDAGAPWEFTDQQARILAYWFAYDDTGRWLYRRGTVRMCKGWGKDPFGAVLALVELCGPCRVGPTGRGIAHNSPWVQVTAVSRDQTRTTMRLLPGLVTPKLKSEHALEVNKEIVYARGGRGVIEAVTSSPSALEGGRATLVIRNETQEWRKANAGHDMAEVIDGNLAKSRDGAARALSMCNAHVPGEDTVGEREWDAYQSIRAGRTRKDDVFYYAIEAPADTRLDDADSLAVGIIAARGDAVWLDPERLTAEIWDPRTTPSEARRKYLNQVVAAEDAWVAPHEWNACAEPGLTLRAGDMVTLGFDGSKSDDHTALAAARLDDGAVFLLDAWDPDRFGGEIPRDAVDGAVAKAVDRYDVVGFYSDVHPFESYIDEWRDRYATRLVVKASDKHPIGWDMRGRQQAVTIATEKLLDAVLERQLKHTGDPRLGQYVANARRRPNRWGVTFGKESRESNRKVDGLAAVQLACMARWDYWALPAHKRRHRTGRAMFV